MARETILNTQRVVTIGRLFPRGQDSTVIYDQFKISGIIDSINRAASTEGLRASLDFFFPLMEECAVTTTLNATQTPDQDARNNLFLAKSTIIEKWAGNWAAIHNNVRIDVKYPSGHIVRYRVEGKTDHGDWTQRTVEISRFLTGNPTGAPTPCR
jgi:hypothetical protein